VPGQRPPEDQPRDDRYEQQQRPDRHQRLTGFPGQQGNVQLKDRVDQMSGHHIGRGECPHARHGAPVGIDKHTLLDFGRLLEGDGKHSLATVWPHDRQHSTIRLDHALGCRDDLGHRPVDGPILVWSRHRQQIEIQPGVEFVHKHEDAARQSDDHQQRAGPEPKIQMQPEPSFAPNMRPMAPARRSGADLTSQIHLVPMFH
jgi:hypothetical protein